MNLRRLTIRGAILYVVLVLGLTALGITVSPLLVGGFVLLAGSLLVLAAERLGDSGGEPWAVTPVSTAGLGRGTDHRAVALARRLGNPRPEPGQREHLATELHAALRAVLVERIRRERGWDLDAHPELAESALPPELAALVREPPDRRLADPAYLSALLDRIESP